MQILLEILLILKKKKKSGENKNNGAVYCAYTNFLYLCKKLILIPVI